MKEKWEKGIFPIHIPQWKMSTKFWYKHRNKITNFKTYQFQSHYFPKLHNIIKFPHKNPRTHFWSLAGGVDVSLSVSLLWIVSLLITKQGRFGAVGILLANWWNFCRLWIGVKLCDRHNDLDGSKYLKSNFKWAKLSKKLSKKQAIAHFNALEIYWKQKQTRISYLFTFGP